MIRNYIFLSESLGMSYWGTQLWESRRVQLAIIQHSMQNPNLQSELANSFTQRRKLSSIYLSESRICIASFLIICLHRMFGLEGLANTAWACATVSHVSTKLFTMLARGAEWHASESGSKCNSPKHNFVLY